MTVTVLYFAQVAEKLGKNKEIIELKDSADSNDLLMHLNDKYPVLEQLKFKLAVNQLLINKTVELEDHCEVALLPPFAGG